jgi:tetratricopeptide (TPR) repeat protein
LASPFARVGGAESVRSGSREAGLDRGADLLARGKPRPAERIFRAVIGSFPDSAVAHSLLAMALADQGRSHDSLKSADEAIRLDSRLALAHAARACALEAIGVPWQAEMEGRQAVALAPTDPNRHSDLAGIVGRAGRYPEALDITSRSLTLNPGHLPSLHCRALALVSLGRADEARELMATAMLEDPDLAQIHASIGLLLEGNGHLAQAAEEYRTALSLDTAVDTAREGLRRLEARYLTLPPMKWRRSRR